MAEEARRLGHSTRIPVLAFPDGSVLVEPTDPELAARLFGREQAATLPTEPLAPSLHVLLRPEEWHRGRRTSVDRRFRWSGREQEEQACHGIPSIAREVVTACYSPGDGEVLLPGQG
jgi:hypothetical protein